MPRKIAADIERKKIHDIYTALVGLADLSPEHRSALQARGFSDPEIKANGYGTLPLRRGELVSTLLKKFPDLSGVPGFWRDDRGAWQLAGKTGVLIPVRAVRSGEIVGMKVRVDKPSSPSNKYLLLGSNPRPDPKTGEVKYPGGSAARIQAHFPLGCPRGKVKLLRITEGEIKADILTSLLPEYTVSLPGVSLWRLGLDIARELHPERILLAFDSDKNRPVNTEGVSDYTYGKLAKDSDHFGSPDPEDFAVGKALGGLYLALREAGFTVEIEDWPAEAGKGLDDVVMAGCADQVTRLTGEEAESFARELLASELPEGWIYVVGVKRFYHIKTLLELDKEQYADRYAHEDTGNPALKALKNAAFPKADLPIYAPARELTFAEEGRRYFNTWRANPLQPARGDVAPFLTHVSYILPDPAEAGIFLDWLAYCVQQPGRKIHWAILLQGVQGTGKSYFGAIMRMMLGAGNVSSPTNEQIHEIFTAWQKSCQLVIIEEVMARGRLELMNKLKPMITQEITTIREMHKPAYEQPNVFNLLLLTNHEDAIILDQTDRRYCVLFSPAAPRPPEYYEGLWRWTLGAAPALLDYFRSRDLAAFRPKAHAPDTAAKRSLVAASMPPLIAWLGEAVAAEEWPFLGDLVTTAHLAECLPRSLGNSSLQALGRALKAVGARELGQVSLTSGAKARLWAVRRQEIWASAGRVALAAEYEKWASAKEPGGNPLAEARPM